MLYVNNEKIEQKEINAEIERLTPEYENVFVSDNPAQRQEYADQLAQWSRENVIERVLFAQIARKEYPDIKDDQARVKKLIDRITADVPAPTEDQLKQFYTDNPDQFTAPERIRASHIVLHPNPQINPDDQKEQMRKMLWEVRNNGSFDQAAAEHSDCPENAGDLGYFIRGQMVPEFEDVVFNMEVGDISDVFQTPFGFHIAKVTDKHPSMVVPFEQVHDSIKLDLTEQFRQRAIEDFLDAEKLKAAIEEKDE